MPLAILQGGSSRSAHALEVGMVSGNAIGLIDSSGKVSTEFNYRFVKLAEIIP